MKSIKITSEMVEGFCTAVGDSNPLHKEPYNIVPGMLLASLFTNKPKPNYIIRSFDIKFSKPVVIGETVDITEHVLDTKTTMKFFLHNIEYRIAVNGVLRQTMKAHICELR